MLMGWSLNRDKMPNIRASYLILYIESYKESYKYL
jgi:hypothetical protein